MSQKLYEKYKDSSQEILNLRFTAACLAGNLEEVSYVLSSPKLKVHADIHTRYDQGLLYACNGRHYELVKYLLSSPDLKEYADIHASDGLVLLQCCEDGNLDMVKFLLSSPHLKEHANIHADDDSAFIAACIHRHLDIIQYFIFDQNVPKSSYIKEYLNDQNNDKKFVEQVNHLFSLRNLGENLEKELCNDIQNTRKIKI
jgi:hypothetical protein